MSVLYKDVSVTVEAEPQFVVLRTSTSAPEYGDDVRRLFRMLMSPDEADALAEKLRAAAARARQ
jgi:hypothetical protein